MMLQRLTKFGLLLAVAIIVLTLAFEAPVVKGQGKGKGGGGNDSSRDVPGIAEFDDLSGVDRIVSDLNDGQGLPYDFIDKDLASTGGWANFPPSGNFTLKTAGGSKKQQENGRKLTLDFFESLSLEGLPTDCDVEVDQGEADSFAARPQPIQTPAFMGVNRTDGGGGGNGLEGMGPDDSEATAGIGANFVDPNDSKATFFLRCGLDVGDKDACGTDSVNVDCVAANMSGQCVEWQIKPDPRNELRCRVWRDSRGNSALIGDFNMPFGLTVFRDADSNGDPDPGNSF